MSFVGKIIKAAAPIVAGVIGGPLAGAAVGAAVGATSGGGIKGAVLGGLGGYGAANLLTGTGVFGASTVAGTGVNLANATSTGINLAGNIAGAGVQIAPAAFDAALSSSTSIWSTAASAIGTASKAVNTVSNVYKAVAAVNNLTGETRLVDANNSASSLGANWSIPVGQTPVTVDANTSPIGANNSGGFTSTSTMPASQAKTTSNSSYMPLLLIAGAAYLVMKGKVL